MYNNTTLHDKIYRQIAKKYGIHIDVVEKACRSQLEFVVNTMRSGSRFSVRLKYLGLFGVKDFREKYRDKFLKEYEEKKAAGDNSNQGHRSEK